MASLFHRNEIVRPPKPVQPIPIRLLPSSLLGLWLGVMLWSPVMGQTTAVPVQAIPAPVIPDGPAAETVLETLWRNNLYSIANDACRAQVELLPAGSDARIRWQCWFIRGLASEAIDVEDRSPPDVEKAKQNWTQIESIHQETLATTPQPFRGLWIRWQYLHAIHLRSQGAMARYLANPLDSTSRDQALAAIRDLDRGAEQLQKSIAEMVVTNSASTTVQARKQIRELQELSTETALLRCEALALRGQAYPLQSADAIAAGTEMEQFAIEAAGKIATDWSGRSKLELALAVSKWLQGNQSETLERTQALLQSNDSRVRIRALDLLIQAALAAGKRDLAEETLQQFQSLEATPEFALAHMRLALFDLPQAATSDSNRQQLMSRLLASRDSIGQRFGGYWQRRAEALLLSLKSSSGTDTMQPSLEATELVRIEVRQLIAANRLEDAVNKLLQQAALLKRDQVNNVAMQLTLQAAAIQQKEKNWSGSGDLFRQAAIDFPKEKDASAAHLMAIYCMTQAVRSTPNDKILWGKLDDSFIEQLQLFPDDPASLQAAYQYAQSANYRRIWQTAASKMRPVIAKVYFSHDLAWLVIELEMRGIYWQHMESDPRTMESVRKCLMDWREWAANLDKDASLDSLRSLSAFAQLVVRDMLPESLAIPLEADASLEPYRNQWTKTKLRPEEPGYVWKEAWQAVISAKQDIAAKRTLTDKSIETLANTLGVVGKEASVNETDNGSDNGNSPVNVLAPSLALWAATEVILEQLEYLSPPQRSDSREAMTLLLKWLNQAREQSSWKAAPTERLDLLRWRLDVFGRDRQSYLNQLELKIKGEPRVPVWQRVKALLLETGGADELEQALGIYRRLAAGAKNGSYDWLRARYRSALCLLWLNKKEDAKQAAEVILLTHPPTEPLWKSRLETIKGLK